ncbi:Zinc finger and SCAN domain-containing protein 29 [Chelonia mydas]|uniref:Zinc finger and SCAN domain-containing protein 29 n=1 Tax=Chelonia mydas TaxID=8469 RepID=M7C322_CHEMY|nr:Zinc finger and SCAN domain-containing protein 29 [Chelonia mydas]
MQSSSAEVTMMEYQNRKRAPAWTEREVRDLITVWGEESVLSELRSSFRNAKTFVKISQGMKDRGHNRDPKQCRVKLKELRQAYQKTREANGRSGSEPQICRFYDELRAILAAPSGIGISTQNSNGQRRLRELWDSYPQCNTLEVDACLGTVEALRRVNALNALRAFSVGNTHSNI